MALFIMFRYWRVADTWEKVAKFFQAGRVWCIVIYKATINDLCFHYRQVVKVIDYARVTPKLEEWCNVVNEHFVGGEDDTLYFADRKPWKLSQPGEGQSCKAISEMANANNVNLVQKAY